jgi:hypothetical protein
MHLPFVGLPIHTLELLNGKEMLETFNDDHPSLFDAIRIVTNVLSYFNSCLNLFLYALVNKEEYSKSGRFNKEER